MRVVCVQARLHRAGDRRLGLTETGEQRAWQPQRLRLRPWRVLASWVRTAVALVVAAWTLPGVHLADASGALLVLLLVGALNAVVPPMFAALRVPFTLVLGFLLALLQIWRRELQGANHDGLDTAEPVGSPAFAAASPVASSP